MRFSTNDLLTQRRSNIQERVDGWTGGLAICFGLLKPCHAFTMLMLGMGCDGIGYFRDDF
jgi:hypothetical protein